MLNHPTGVSEIPNSGATFQETLSGTAPFVLERASTGPSGMPLVDLEWTCRTLPAAQVLPRPPGYVVSLADLGCQGSPAQRLILRFGSVAGEPAASAEVYGAPRARIRMPTTETTEGLRFEYSKQQVSMIGTVRDMTPTSATFELEHATWAGVPMCTAGVYTLPRSQ